jgi:hypothetical protein
MSNNPPAYVRAWLYRLALVAFAVILILELAVRAGLLDGEPSGVLDLIVPFLGFGASGLATHNTSATRDDA